MNSQPTHEYTTRDIELLDLIEEAPEAYLDFLLHSAEQDEAPHIDQETGEYIPGLPNLTALFCVETTRVALLNADYD